MLDYERFAFVRMVQMQITITDSLSELTLTLKYSLALIQVYKTIKADIPSKRKKVSGEKEQRISCAECLNQIRTLNTYYVTK